MDNVISAFIDFKLNNYDFLESLSFLLNLEKKVKTYLDYFHPDEKDNFFKIVINNYHQNTYILSDKIFEKKYPLFDIKIFKNIYPQYSNCSDLECKALCHNNKLMSSFENYLEEDKELSIENKKSFNKDVNEYFNKKSEIINSYNKIVNEDCKILIIYVYYERKNETRNQTNLQYFLNYGLGKRWKKYNINTLLIINNECELYLPEMDNLIILKREYNNEYDIGSYKIGIDFMEKKHGEEIHKEYTHIMFMNSSVCGPFFDYDDKTHWIEPFLKNLKMKILLFVLL